MTKNILISKNVGYLEQTDFSQFMVTPFRGHLEKTDC